MPQVFKVGGFIVYFWVNEGVPLDPIHVHVAEGVPFENGTKIWLTKAGKTLLCHNKSQVPENKLKTICELIESRFFEISSKWQERFNTISYYC